MSIDLKPARVRVPCSTSNLGSGYDTIGLALDRYVEASYEPAPSGGIVVEWHGFLARLAEEDSSDLVAETFTRVLSERGLEPSGLLRLDSQVPVARGLGTSAAAVLAGYDLALAAVDQPSDRDGAFATALEHEGHGDNAAPSLHGGLKAVAKTPDGPVIIPLQLSDAIGFAYAAPAAGIETAEARGILPESVPHGVAAGSLGRLVALMRGLRHGDPDLLRIGVTDELHVPHRLPLIPGAAAAMSAATDAGAWAVTVSGAGSGLIAMSDPGDAAAVAAAMHAVFDADSGDPECVGFAVRPDHTGLVRLLPLG